MDSAYLASNNALTVVRQDLTEMVISAQQRGENIRSAIGEDYKAFVIM